MSLFLRPGRNATSSLALRRAVAGPGLTSKWRYSQESTPPRVADEDLEEVTSKATCRLRSTTRSHLEPYRPVPESRNLAHGIDRQDPQSACAACGLPVSTRLPAASAVAPTRRLSAQETEEWPIVIDGPFSGLSAVPPQQGRRSPLPWLQRDPDKNLMRHYRRCPRDSAIEPVRVGCNLHFGPRASWPGQRDLR